MASGSQTFNSTGTWTCPVGVIQVTVQCWGAGGGGGTGSVEGKGGGGGGAYSSSVIDVQPGLTYPVTVGAGGTEGVAGGDSWFNTSAAILAKGGSAGSGRTGGAGGAAGSCIGSTKHSGGAGATSTGASAGGGGGGGSATSSADGSNGSANSSGTGGAGGSGEGAGGAGANHGAVSSNNGVAPGGGGGGACDGPVTSGTGAAGRVALAWAAVQPDSSATTELQKQVARSGTWLLEGRQVGGAWTAITYYGHQPDVHWVKGQARSCNFSTPWFEGCNDESDAANLIRLRVEVRVTAQVLTDDGLQSVVKFQGPIIGIAQTDYGIDVTAQDWSVLYQDCSCQVQKTPTTASVIDSGVRGRVFLIADGAYGKAYGLDVADFPDAFNNAGTLRRPWVPGTTQLWMTSDTSKTSNKYLVPTSHWQINYESGAISILEPDHPVDEYSSTTTLKIPGDFSKYFLDTVQFTIAGSTDNDGTYTCDGDSSYSAGFTTITTVETLTTGNDDGTVYRDFYWVESLSVYLETGGTAHSGGITGINVDLARLVEQAFTYAKLSGGMGLSASDYYLPDSGIDLGMAYSYTGSVAGLLGDISKHFQANLQIYYDPTLVQSGTYPTWVTGKHRMAVVSQASSADWTMARVETGITQGRSTRDLATRIKITGKSELPENSINQAIITDWTTAPADWAGFDGNSIIAGSFEEVYPYIYNGNDAMGALAHNLGPTADYGGTMGQPYAGWWQFIQGDFGSVQDPVTLVRCVMPSSRNDNAQGGDQRDPANNQGFWPGVWIQVSENGTDWVSLAPQFYGNFQPGSVITADETQITAPRFRYFRVYCQAYKEGTSNQNDPAIGLGELAFYFDAAYTVIKQIQGTDPAGGYSYTNGTFVSNYYPDLLTRCDNRTITYEENIGNRYNEFLANDYALLLFEDRLRLYAIPEWGGTTDPRIEPWDTVAITDNLGGNVSGILVEEVHWEGLKVQVKGTNYRDDIWGT